MPHSDGAAGAACHVAPLLKWAGGKRQLLPQLRRFYPATFDRYIEPFFGSGAVFFDLYSAGRLDGRPAILIDSNPDLIGCYETVRDRTDAVASALTRLAREHARAPRAHYMAVRDERFNPTRARLRRDDGRIAYTPELAAMLIYLNRTGFNGLFRVNASGAFNVPPGRYTRPSIPDRDRLLRTAAALASPGVELRWGLFDAAKAIGKRGDFLYFDPPYAPLSPTSSFTSYTAPRFDHDDQVRLQQTVIALASRGCHVLVSNSSADEISELYERNRRIIDAGVRTHRVPARRAINSNAARRGAVDEFIIANIAAR